MTHTEFRSTLKSLHLTQRSLAERLGVQTSTVNRLAQDNRAAVHSTVEIFSPIVEIFGGPTMPASKPAPVGWLALRRQLLMERSAKSGKEKSAAPPCPICGSPADTYASADRAPPGGGQLVQKRIRP